MFSRRTSWDLASNRFSRALDAERRAGKSILDLTASNPTQVGIQYNQAEILSALAHPDALTYHPEPKGLPAARTAVADYYAERGQRISPAAVTLTVSTSEAYSFVFRLLCDPGDEVLVPTPSYPLFEFLAALEDVRLVPYSLFYDHGWHVDLHSLESALTPQARAILLVHPNNPTGSYVKSSEAEQLNWLCQRRGLALVVDEVFFDYRLNAADNAAGSFASNREALSFTLSGISKISGLPQMKLAWIVTSGPEEQVAPALSRLEVIADTFLSMNAPVQLAAPVLLAQRHGVGEQLRARIRTNLAELDRQLAQQQPCSRLVAEGGWYVILRVPVNRSDEQLCIDLLQQAGVLVQPGYFYDFHQDGHLVLSLITPQEQFAEGVRRIVAFVIGNL